MSTAQVQSLFAVLSTVTDPARALPSASEKVQVGVEIVSPAVKLSVIVSPFIPPVVSVLSVTIDTGVRVGAVVSITKAVRANAAAALPASSVNVTVQSE